MQYQCWTNIDARFARAYEPGDRLVRGWQGEMEPEFFDSGNVDFATMAEQVFDWHNRDDRPDGQMCPSMSVGDVVQFGEVALSVAFMGFTKVSLSPSDLITDQTWLEVVRG